MEPHATTSMIKAKSEPYFNNALENACKKPRSQPSQGSSIVTFTNLHSLAYVRVESHFWILVELGSGMINSDSLSVRQLTALMKMKFRRSKNFCSKHYENDLGYYYTLLFCHFTKYWWTQSLSTFSS